MEKNLLLPQFLFQYQGRWDTGIRKMVKVILGTKQGAEKCALALLLLFFAGLTLCNAYTAKELSKSILSQESAF